MKNKKKTKTLKKLKEELNSYLAQNKNDKALLVSEKIKELYPKNPYGYLWYLKLKTGEYTKFLREEELKSLKKVFEKLYEVSSKKEKIKIKVEFDEYINDCKEIYNLEKIKKEKVGKVFLKKVYEDKIQLINKNTKKLNSYSEKSFKIRGIYDLIKGLVLLFCLVFNLINRNYLLLLTVPFGIFGIITIYGFIDTNLFKKNYAKEKNDEIKDFFKEAEIRKEECNKEIEKIDEAITFLNEQLQNSILKIPKFFSNEVSIILNDDEEEIAKELILKLDLKEEYIFSQLLEEKTNINAENFISKLNDENSFFKSKIITSLEPKKTLNMKETTFVSMIVLLILCLVSICFFAIIIKNFYELNFLSFVVALIMGLIFSLIYNIEKGKHCCLTETFSDNLCTCIFISTLVYNLIYSRITNELYFTYNFIEIPLIFTFLFIGPVMLVSRFKYNHLYKKLIN